MADPRDPRKTGEPAIERVAKSLDTYLSSQASVTGEVAMTNRAIAESLEAVSQQLADLASAQGGVGGVGPSIPTNIEARRQFIESIRGFTPGQETVPDPRRDPTKAASPNRAQQLPGAPTAGAGTVPGGGAPGVADRRTPHTPRRALTDYHLDPAQPLGPQTRRGIREGVFASLSARADEAASPLRSGTMMDLDRNLITLRPGVSLDPFSGNYVDEGGNFLRAEDAIMDSLSPDEQDSLANRAARYGYASQVMRGWSQGQPIGRSIAAALPTGAIKAAGLAGAGVFLADRGLRFFQDQHEANRQLQEVYGGGNLEFFGERARRWWERSVVGRFDPLGMRNIEALQQGATQLGLRGDDMQTYMGVGRDIMGQGVNAQQTQRLLELSINAGQGLAGLADAIEQVNQSARDAGINASRAREVFLQNYEASSSIMFGSPAAQELATYATMGQLRQARPFQQYGLMPGFDHEGSQYLQAFRAGMTYPEHLLAQRESPGGAIMAQEEDLKLLLNSLQSPTGERMEDFVDRWVRENGGYEPRFDQIALGDALLAEGWDPNMVAVAVRSRGHNISPDAVLGWAGNLFTDQSPGNISLRGEQERIEHFRDRQVVESEGDRRRPGTAREMDPTIAGDFRDFFFEGPSPHARGTTRGLRMAYASGLAGEAVTTETLDEALIGRERSPIVEAFINQLGDFGITTDRDGRSDARVRVRTGSGFRVVTLDEALRYFQDQIESGDAIFVDGVSDEYIGAPIAEALGVPAQVRGEIDVTSSGAGMSGLTMDDVFGGGFRDAFSDTLQRASAGEDFEQWREDLDRRQEEDRRERGEGERVVLELTDEAKRLLRFHDEEYMNPTAPEWDGYTVRGG